MRAPADGPVDQALRPARRQRPGSPEKSGQPPAI